MRVFFRRHGLPPAVSVLLLVSGTLLPASPHAASEDPEVLCLKEAVRMEVDADGKEARWREDRTYAIRHAGDEAESLRKVVLFEAFLNHPESADIWIWNREGMRLRKHLGDFEERDYRDDLTKMTDTRYFFLKLPRLVPGDTLRIRSKIKMKPFIGFPVITLPATPFPVAKTVFETKIPRELAPRFRTWNGLGDPEVVEVGDAIVWIWSLSEPEPFVDEPGGPPREDVLPTVSVGVNRIAWGEADSWESLGAAYWRKAREKLRPLDPSAFPSRRGIDTAPLDLALERVQNNIRYLAIILGEGSFIPHTTDEIVRRKFGDCKDMATTLLSILGQQEGPGSLAMVRTRGPSQGLKIDPLPTLAFFDHMVVHAPHDQGWAWLDATHRYSTPANPRSDIQGAPALVVSGPRAGFRRIDVNHAESNRHRCRIRLTENSQRDWMAEVLYSWTGGPAQDVNSFIESGGSVHRLAAARVADLQLRPLRELTTEQIHVGRPAPDTLNLVLTFPVHSPVNVNRSTMKPSWERDPYPLALFADRDRVHDVYWNLPGTYVDEFMVKSAFMRWADIPDSTWKFEGNGLTLEIEQKTGPDSVTLLRSCTVSGLTYPASGWAEAREARRRILRWSALNLLAD